MWLFFTLLAASLWGAGQVFTKKGLQEISPLFNNILGAIVILLLTIPFALLNGVDFSLVAKLLPLTLVIAALLLCYYYVIAQGQVSLTGTVLALYPCITVVLSLFFLHEQPSLFQKLAIILILLGAVILAIGEDIQVLKKFKINTWFWWATGGGLSIGISDFLAKIAVNKGGIYTYIFTYGIAFLVVVLISFIFDKKGRQLPKFTARKFLPTIVGVTMVEAGLVSFYIAMASGLISVVAPLSSVYVAITAVLAWFFLKERINRFQMVGIVFSIIGVVLVSIK